MILTNHHSHTLFSDGKASAEAMLNKAISYGVQRYGFSDHAPVPMAGFGIMDPADLGDYGRVVDGLREAYAEEITVYKSLEVDYIPGLMNVNSDYIEAAQLDYTVGAVHYLELLDGNPWSFQRPNPSFERGINELFGGSPRQMVERYYELKREMILNHPPDIVAHLDRIKKRNLNGSYWDEHDEWYKKEIYQTLDIIAEAGIIMEVNTRGIYRGEILDTYPSRWIVEAAHARGIPLQVNSDAHELDHVVGAFDQAYTMLREIGIPAVQIFDGAGFVEVEI